MFDSLFPSHWTTLRKLMWLKLKGASAAWSTITGNPVSFTAKAAPLRQLEVAFSPVQDLHGYDAPWPAGGGKNKINASDVTLNEAGYIFNGAVNLPAGTYTINFSGAVNSASMAILDADGNAMVTGSHNVPYIFTLNADAVSARFYVASAGTYSQIQIEAGSTATAYAPYSNICPISGWDSLHVYDDPLYAGVIEWNQLAEPKDTPHTQNGITTNFTDGVYELSGVRSASYSSNMFSIPIVDGHIYYQGLTVKANPNSVVFAVGPLNSGLDTVSTSVLDKVSTATASKTMTLGIQNLTIAETDTTGIKYCYILCDLTQMFGAGNEPATVEAFKALFPKEYYPANKGTETLVGTVNGMDTRSISITLGSTVYSGTVDVVTGVVTVTHKSRTFSGSDSWNGSNPGVNANLSISDMASGSHYSDPFAICDTLPKVSVISGTTPEVRIGASNTSVYLYNMSSADASITSSATLNTYLASHPIMITYPLATPIPIQLTPQEVQSLAGDNTMWSNANQPITVTYRQN